MNTRLWLVPLVLPCLGPAPPQAPTFKSGVEAVRVDVLVTRGGVPVPGSSPPTSSFRQRRAAADRPRGLRGNPAERRVRARHQHERRRRAHAAPARRQPRPARAAEAGGPGGARDLRRRGRRPLGPHARFSDTIRTALDRAEPSGDTSLVDWSREPRSSSASRSPAARWSSCSATASRCRATWTPTPCSRRRSDRMLWCTVSPCATWDRSFVTSPTRRAAMSSRLNPPASSTPPS